MANLQPAQYAGPCSSIHLESYISGYFDGEGCFSVALAPRRRLRVGWEVRPSVSVSQNGDRRQVIDLVAAYFECGSIRPDRSDLTVKWETRRLEDLVGKVLPHFVRWPLLSEKQRDAVALIEVCSRMTSGEHLDPMGLLSIVRIVSTMNPSGIRRYPIEMIEQQVSKVKA